MSPEPMSLDEAVGRCLMLHAGCEQGSVKVPGGQEDRLPEALKLVLDTLADLQIERDQAAEELAIEMGQS